MRNTKEVEHTRIKYVVEDVKCALCGNLFSDQQSYDHPINEFNNLAADIERDIAKVLDTETEFSDRIEAEVGVFCRLEHSNSSTTSFSVQKLCRVDICPSCFLKKFLPWVESFGHEKPEFDPAKF